MLDCRLFLFFILTLLSVNCKDLEIQTELDMLVAQIYEPYLAHYQNFEEKFISDIWNPLNFLFQLLIDKPSECELGFIEKEVDSSISMSPPTISTPRMLQGVANECLNGGVAVDAMTLQYTCKGNRVSKADYESRKEQENCQIVRIKKSLCYCPFDTYGEYCENINHLVCSAEPVTYPKSECPDRDTKNYVYSADRSDMPCYQAHRDSNLNLEFSVKCEPSDSHWNYEGVKINEEIEKDPTQTFNFKYNIDAGDIKISNSSPGLFLKFINWKNVHDPLLFEEKLTASHLTGKSPVSFPLKLDNSFDRFRFGGRYFYELQFNGATNSGHVSGVFEDAEYEGLQNKKTSRDYTFLFYLGVISFLLLGIVFVVLFRKNLICIGQSKRKEKYEPLIELHEFDRTPSSATSISST